jgi:hypothetical protein
LSSSANKGRKKEFFTLLLEQAEWMSEEKNSEVLKIKKSAVHCTRREAIDAENSWKRRVVGRVRAKHR